jgi:hypothetical protein
MSRFFIVDGLYDSGPFTISQLHERKIHSETVLRHEKTRLRMFAKNFGELSDLFTEHYSDKKKKFSNKFKDINILMSNCLE